MEKSKLIDALKNAYELEEGYVPEISKFFLKDFEWGPVEIEKKDRVKKMLKRIMEETIEHSRMLKEMISEIKGFSGNEV
jgi:hypothetical protein